MVENTSKPVVVITGVSGYLGSHVALAFLKDGTYQVRGTVRSTQNAAKIEPIKKAFGEHFANLTLVEADLENKDSIIAAIQGADYVVHTASPFPLHQPKNEQDLIRPAVQGTLAVMEGCKANKVKRCVITSSVASIMNQRAANKPADNRWTEQNWSEAENNPDIEAYSKSKTLAERAAWDFQAALPESERFEIATVNPGLILGPAFVGAGFSSGDVIQKFMNGSFPAIPRAQIMCVDVRDCATAHVEALKRPEAANKRFILVHSSLWLDDIAAILAAEFNNKGYKITLSKLPKWTAWMASFFYKDLNLVLKNWGKEFTFVNDQSRQCLGIAYDIPMAQTINDMVYSMIETGVIANKLPNQQK